MFIHELMSHPVITAPPALALSEAAYLMKSRGIRRLPVMQDQQLLGIVTDRDVREGLVQRSAASPWIIFRTPKLRLADIMRRQVLTVTADADLYHAAQLMLHHRIGALPVLDAQAELVGLITVTDLLRGLIPPLSESPDAEQPPDRHMLLTERGCSAELPSKGVCHE